MENDDRKILMEALRIARLRKPKSSPEQHQAFANAVARLVKGEDSGPRLGGPTVRELVALQIHLRSKKYSFDHAVRILIRNKAAIFGPLTKRHYDCSRECWHYEDPPNDSASFAAANADLLFE